MEPYTLIDLFAGCGGMTRGFEDTGRFRSVFAVDGDRDAAKTYRENFGEHVAQTLTQQHASSGRNPEMMTEDAKFALGF
ncbi:MAG: DNA cytosine methyltransferase [bacterium]